MPLAYWEGTQRERLKVFRLLVAGKNLKRWVDGFGEGTPVRLSDNKSIFDLVA